jgi:predicted nucleotidyltransferase
MYPDLINALHEFADLFEARGYRYAVMGGIAARILGIPRPTYDIDFTLAVERSELASLFDAAEEAGYYVPVAYRSGWVDMVAGMPIVKLGMQLGEMGIDIDVFISESEFQNSILNRRSQHDVGGKLVWLVSPEDLILLKALANRDRDRGDIQDVLFMQGELDREYMRQWAERLGASRVLEESLRKSDESPDTRP